jgi:hypothetical protein
MPKLPLVLLFFLFYSLFWMFLFAPTNKTTGFKVTHLSKAVLASVNVKPTMLPKPQEQLIPLTPRKQQFNLSCEFAAASAIIYFFTKNEQFAPEKEAFAEKKLLNTIGPSQNPDVGVRMGDDSLADSEKLYKNINNKFGGTEYYGVHAPPFIDLFAGYGLKAVPIDKQDTISAIKQAIDNHNLIMTWIQIGSGESVDVALAYGTVPIIKGEHVVIIHGYTKDGVYVMDPGIGASRHITYAQLQSATEKFSMPFLQIQKSDKPIEASFDDASVLSAKRVAVPIAIKNGSKRPTAASEMAEILKTFGYTVVKIEPADLTTYDGVSITLPKAYKDFSQRIKKDLLLVSYKITSLVVDETATPSAVSIIVGN